MFNSFVYVDQRDMASEQRSPPSVIRNAAKVLGKVAALKKGPTHGRGKAAIFFDGFCKLKMEYLIYNIYIYIHIILYMNIL